MPANIDPETMNVDKLPGVWSPVQWELGEAEQVQETETQAAASLLAVVDVPEAILRLLLNEWSIERAYYPPEGYDPDAQGEWDEELVTFQFERPVQLVKVAREENYLYVEYKFGELGHWGFEITPDKVTLERI